MNNNDNSGALFKNDKKREGKSDADYQGQVTIDGREYWLNAWLNTTKDGKSKYMSLKAKAKTGGKPKPNPIVEEITKQFPGAAIMDDEIPF